MVTPSHFSSGDLDRPKWTNPSEEENSQIYQQAGLTGIHIGYVNRFNGMEREESVIKSFELVAGLNG